MEDLPAAAASLGLDQVVEFVPRLPRAETLREMSEASCLLILQPGTTVAVPGKLYEYLAVGRPILALTEEGETADLVRESGLGAVVPPSDESAIEAALLDLLSAGPNQRPRRPSPGLYDGNLSADHAIAVMERSVTSRARASARS
jgi:glycosyltransferase involved in cell wall biosynthesis